MPDTHYLWNKFLVFSYEILTDSAVKSSLFLNLNDMPTKRELGREILENMDLTKEQYMELCALCDDLDLEKKGEEPEEEREMSWEELDRLQ